MAIRLSPAMNIMAETTYKSEVIDGRTHVYIINDIVVDNSNMEQRIKVASLVSGKTMGELADRLNVSQTNLLSRSKTGKFTFPEQREIAEAIGCKLIVKFVFPDSSEFTGDTVKEMVSDSCLHAGITQNDLATMLGKTKQTFSSKLKMGRFTDEDLEQIAGKLGCNYYNYFELNDGTRI